MALGDRDRLLRTAVLTLATLLSVGVSWYAAASASAAGGTATALDLRAAPAARGAVLGPSSLATGRQTPFGSLLVLASGIPLTVVDRGSPIGVRAARDATVADVLRLAGVELGPDDELVAPDRPAVAAGDVIRVLRVKFEEQQVREPVPFAVRTVADPTLPAGRVAVATPGTAGVADNTYRVRLVDGAEASRELVASVTVTEPVAEVRRVGTYRPAPAGPAEITAIIRAAAERWGADPEQLLRVAYCESRYDPNAYNASSGASGLFQFLPSTWAANSPRAGYGGASAFDPVANANTAAYMFGRQQAYQWVCK